jgi:Na+:H+ antiporter, NhaA family
MRPFLRWAADHSLALPAGALIGLVWANLSGAGHTAFAHSLHFVVNDVAMAFFFALAAKEVVEATLPGGALHSWRTAALPIVAAAGGVVGPALVYTAIVRAIDQPGLARGWAIPCATDIAFSYLVAKAIFRDHPAIPFLLLLAIADDAIGLVILAVFYPSGGLRPLAGLLLMAVALAACQSLRRFRVRSFWPYILGGGSLSWVSLYWGGLHPALALVPIVAFMPHARRDPGMFVEAPPSAHDPLSEFERWWKYPVQVVLFLFGAVNAGVPFSEVGPGTWAVLGAIVVGKPLGILAFVIPAVKAAGLRLPARLSWTDLIVVGVAASIGFTVALFFAIVAFPARTALEQAYLDQTKMGALFSVVSAGVAFGAAALLRVGRFRASAGR